MRIDGARVLLTGATGGIGEAIARTLRSAGADLVLTGRRVDVLARLAAELDATTIAADLALPGATAELLAAAGPLDVLVANAALPAAGALLSFSEAELDRALDVNLRAPILLTRALTEQMLGRGRGHIVLVGSLAGLTASPASSLYSGTKFGLRGFALGHRQDLHGTGVGLSLVEPGFVRDAGMFVDSGMQLPRGVRTVSPEQVARAVLRSIDRDLGEVLVAPAEMRLATRLALLAPRLSAAVQRRAGAAHIVGAHRGAVDKR